MSKVDDELTRRFHRAERPVGDEALFETLERRRSHHERVRRVEVGALAVAVIATTVVGFLLLYGLFRTDRTVGGSSQPGRIVFGRVQLALDADGGSTASDFEIWSMASDGSDLRLVSAPSDGASAPTWSPDGERIAFVERGSGGTRLFGDRLVTTRPDGSDRRLIAEGLVSPPFRAVAWSPDGEQIAVLDTRADGLGSLDEFGIPITDIALYSTEGAFERFVDVPGTATGFTWWPDGRGFAVVRMDEQGSLDLVRVDLEGQVLGSLAQDVASSPPAVSPAGDRVAFVRQEPLIGGSDVTTDDVWTVRADGTDLTRVTEEPGSKPSVAWTPDGSRIVYASQTPDRCDIVSIRPDGSGMSVVAGRDVMGGCAEEISISGSTTSSSIDRGSDVASGGRDIGLGFALCHIEQLRGVDWYGDGTSGAAWTGTRTLPDGRCPEQTSEYVVAADVDGDGVAEPGGMGFLSSCLLCRPFAATDLSGDGVLELVVLEEASSTPSYSLYEVSLPTSERSPGIYNLFVAPPGAPQANLPGGEPVRFIVGGDEGYAGGLRCEGYPEAPVMVYTWIFGEVDADTDFEFHETRLALRDDGVFHVIDTTDSTFPRDGMTLEKLIFEDPACEVDFHPAA